MDSVMARFRLLATHNLPTASGPANFEAGTEIDSASIPGFQCTALMEALDEEAEAMLLVECDRLRSKCTILGYGEIPGFGPIQRLPA